MTQQSPLPTLSLSRRKYHFQPLRPLSSTSLLVQDLISTPPTRYVLKTHTLPSQSALSQLLSETSLWRSLSHPNLLPLVDIFQSNLTVSLLTSYCSKSPLQKPTELQSIRLISDVAGALEYLLQKTGNSHGNIETNHLFFDQGGEVKLGGFGWARVKRMPGAEMDDVVALVRMFMHLIGRKWTGGKLEGVTEKVAAVLEGVLKGNAGLIGLRYELASLRGLVPGKRRAEDRSPVQLVEEGSRGDHLEGDAALTMARQLLVGDIASLKVEDVEAVVRSCGKDDELPESVFKVLFSLHISKNPVVAFKTVTFLHHLLAEGAAKLTALAITHDAFLSWVENSWSRPNLDNKKRKVHVYSNCFAGGEIAAYMSLLRKRIVVHAKFAHILSTHWVPRVDGLATLGQNRMDAVKAILQIVQGCNVLLQTLLACKDPCTVVKQGALPVIVTDLAKAYLTICWLYATADMQTKPLLNQDLAIAHNATRLGMEAIRGDPKLAAVCSSNFLLDLKVDVPVEVDLGAVTAALKKKKKKKKKKVPVGGIQSSEAPANGRVHSFEDVESALRPRRSSPPAQKPIGVLSTDDSSLAEEEPEDNRLKRKPKARSGVHVARRASLSHHHPNVYANDAEGFSKPPPESPRSTSPTKGLAKLSLNVRRTASKTEQGQVPKIAPRTAPRMASPVPEFARSPMRARAANDSTEEVLRGGSRFPANIVPARTPEYGGRPKVSTAKRLGAANPHDADSDPDAPPRGYRMNGRSHVSYRGGMVPRGRMISGRDADYYENDSESSEDEDKPIARRERRSRLKKQQASKKISDSESSDEVDEDESVEEQRRPRRKVTKPKPQPDEKRIPFDKQPPKKVVRSPAQAHGDADYRGGSKEALAAAASGKKTPAINGKFEVAPYEVQFGPQIGSGGFGVVFKAKFRTETVAVKKIHAHALSNTNSIAEFQSEVAVLCTLNHPNILRFVGACTRPPNLMIITEFMSRGTLFDVLHQSQMRVTWPMRKKFALDTCKGMRYLHDSQLLHRDLKSSNLMLDKDFNCKVGDFGLTRISRGAAAVQMTGQCGTFQYMAVEVLANKPYSEKADVFSFGILLWEMVARKLPYFGMQPMQVGIAVLQQGMRPPMPAKCPLPLAKLMRACWDSDPNRRPSFAQLVDALEAMP